MTVLANMQIVKYIKNNDSALNYPKRSHIFLESKLDVISAYWYYS